MLSDKDKAFLLRWEAIRERESHFWVKLVSGLPVALLFGLPILFSIAMVSWLSPEWYTKFSSRLNSGTWVVLLAVFLSILFFSFTRKHFKWEMNEQLYLELKAKEKAADAANEHSNQS